jgi:hypothetical protein
VSETSTVVLALDLDPLGPPTGEELADAGRRRDRTDALDLSSASCAMPYSTSCESSSCGVGSRRILLAMKLVYTAPRR